MIKLSSIALKAQSSNFYRWVLSRLLNYMVPFNGPHKFKISDIGKNHLEVFLPYRRRNLNHLKGLHACALATLAEVSSGLLLISTLDPEKYRLILKELKMEYHYQAKEAAKAWFSIGESEISQIVETLVKEEKTVFVAQVEISDLSGNHVATGIAHWQIKDWKKVKTKR